MTKLLFKHILSVVLLLGCLSAGAQTEKVPAFPGAEGFGRNATGGRGGTVYHVTNLNDSGTGSLRWALSQSGKRIIVFDVSGTIHLNSALNIPSNTTIAGQSAPGDGICVADYPCAIKGNNVIVRYMRFRLGNKNVTKNGADGWDGFGALDQSNFIIDHCSVSWSIDECLSVSGCKNITVQWCIVAQSLVNSGHSKGAHGYGGNWGGSGVSFHHNLMAHHESRTPRLGPRYTTQTDERMDMRNNVIYNWAGNGCYGGEAMNVNIVNNYYKPGPGTNERSTGIQQRIAGIGIRTTEYITTYPSYKDAWHIWGKYYVTGNVNSKYSDVTRDNWTYGMYNQIDASGNDGTYTSVTKDTIKIDTPINFAPVTTHTAADAYEKVLQYAGASLHRDSHDALMVSDTRNGTATYTGSGCNKGCINSQDDNKPKDAGADWSPWPTLNSTAAPADTDGDGMPDAWEDAHGLDKNNAADGNQIGEDGYTNVEVYLNSLVADITAAQNEGGVEMGGTSTVEASYTLSAETIQEKGSNLWTFGDGFTITGGGDYGSGEYSFGTFLVNANTQCTINIPEGVTIMTITFEGYSNVSSSASTLSELNGETVSYEFPKRSAAKTATHKITLTHPATEKITFTVSGRSCMKIQLDGYKKSDGSNDDNGGTENTELESIATDGTVTWPFGDGKADQAGTVSANVSPWIDHVGVSIGSTLATVSKKSVSGMSFTQFMPSIENEGNANDNNAVTFSFDTKAGYYFQPTAISFNATRLGTDGGKIGIYWKNGYGKTFIDEIVPDRDSKDFVFSQQIDDQSASEGNNALMLHIYGLKNKYIALANIVITGDIKTNEAAGISTVTSQPSDNAVYTLQGLRVSNPKKGLYIIGGKKVVLK